MSTTLISSSNVVPLRPDPDPEGFAQTRERWLSRWFGDPRLKHSHRALLTQIFLHFNTDHFKETGHLLAWPSWQKLMAATGGLSETSVFRGLGVLERLGAIEVEHGRYDHKTKKRAGNRYLVTKSNLAPAQPCNGDQPCASVQNQPCAGARRLDESDSVNLKKEKNGNSSRGPSAPVEDSKPSPRSACDVPRRRADGDGGGRETDEERRARWEREGKSPFTGCPIWKRGLP